MAAIMALVCIYVSAQSPGAPPIHEPVGIPPQLQQVIDNLAEVRTYCLDDAYQRKEKYQDLITHYSSVPYTHVQLATGSTPIADWLPTIQVKIAEIEAYIAALEAQE